MKKPDITFIHPPSIYDFRERGVLLGPISDVIPSTPLFEMYPIGLVSLSEYLARHSMEARIINLAMKMIKKPLMDVERYIKSIRTRTFGIDLHWMPHVQGTLAIAGLIKKHHPDVPVILGGYSATYYHKEIMEKYQQVDFIVRGDSTEVPLSRLLEEIDGNENFMDIPNLTYRMDGEVVVNELGYISGDTDYINIDYAFMIKQALKYWDFTAYQPFAGWYQYPITSVYSVRGCLYNCITCGGAAEAVKNNCGREEPAYRSPELMVADIKRISELFNSPIFVIGDLLQPGRDYFNRFSELLGKFDIQNQIIYEFFTPPDEDAIARIARNTRNFNVEISIETHDEEIRRRFGRPYTNDELERFIEDVLYYNCGRLDIFAMIGLSGQDKNSVYDTIDYFDYLLNRFNDTRVYPFISPLAPFIDPGSIVFENPEEFGYRLFYKTLEEHKTAVENAPSWKYLLNYETRWMTRNDIVDVTYQSAMALNDIKRNFGLITTNESYHIRDRIKKAMEIVDKVDEILKQTAGDEQKEGLMNMEDDLREYNIATICGEGEWKWDIEKFPYNIWGILKEIWTGWWGV